MAPVPRVADLRIGQHGVLLAHGVNGLWRLLLLASIMTGVMNSRSMNYCFCRFKIATETFLARCKIRGHDHL